MAVEQYRLRFRQQRVVLVDVAPPRLDHPDLRIGEVREQSEQEVPRRDEIRVEDRDIFAARDLQAGLERARLVTDAVPAVQVLDVDPLGRVAPHRELGNTLGLVGRVVEHLDLQQLARIIDGAHRLDQPVGDVHLVVERKLDRDRRKRIQRRTGLRLPIAVAHVQVDQVIPVPPVNRENDEDKEVCGERKSFSGRHLAQSFILLSVISKVNKTAGSSTHRSRNHP
jgi:hypothetical protein